MRIKKVRKDWVIVWHQGCCFFGTSLPEVICRAMSYKPQAANIWTRRTA